MREIWDWDASTYLGSIPEANQTYNVVGNANEHGVIIGETTFGGLKSLDGHGTGAIIDCTHSLADRPFDPHELIVDLLRI